MESFYQEGQEPEQPWGLFPKKKNMSRCICSLLCTVHNMTRSASHQLILKICPFSRPSPHWVISLQVARSLSLDLLKLLVGFILHLLTNEGSLVLVRCRLKWENPKYAPGMVDFRYEDVDKHRYPHVCVQRTTWTSWRIPLDRGMRCKPPQKTGKERAECRTLLALTRMTL